ncbi:winged helix-turn-helix transcriptional regulator [Pseudonocardia hispaniensis]|uniref:Winged helix-turn-helix transcriptional regulator n=1 Tax=Pseudonocardia hispaniensis TaxID=904933 RepID=A0ABW1J6S8_9PSEU
MGSRYGQFCPVAKAMELLDERWTLLVIRELVCGSKHFNELRRGVPRMSPALLSKRLQRLIRAGVVERRPCGNRVDYVLTDAGRELRPIVDALGTWGTRWIGELGDEDLDPHLLLWDMHRHIDHTVVPGGRTVVRFVFPDAPASTREWWMVITPDEVDVCDSDPGYPVAVSVETTLRRLVEIWRGDVDWAAAIRAGEVVLHGPASIRRALPAWFTLSAYATVPRTGRATVRLP